MKFLVITAFWSCIMGAIQMYWFLPDGLSCIDAKSGVIEAIIKFMIIQFVAILGLQYVLKAKAIYTIPVFLCVFWFFINKNEFTYRHACWSTFSNQEIIEATLIFSIVPMITCLVVFLLGYFLMAKWQKRGNTIAENK